MKKTNSKGIQIQKKIKVNMSMAYQLGFYIGEHIYNNYLPTLSVDSLQTNNVISVTCGESDECKRLESIWFDSGFGNDDGDKWNACRAYHKLLQAKYLSETIDCRLNILTITNEADLIEFKRGISTYLWNCDRSYYSTKIEDIDVKNINGDEYDIYDMFTVITLKKHHE